MKYSQFITENLSILSEATISEANIEKVLKVFIKYAEKKLGKLYRYGGSEGTVEYGKGIGYLYFTRTGKAFRINYEKREINTISIWKKFKLGHKADFTVDFSGLNLMQIAKDLVEIITHPKTDKIAVALNENLNLFEAKRISPADFYNLVADNIGPNENPEAMRFDRIKAIADANDVQVPSFVRNNKAARGLFSVKPTGDSAVPAKVSGSPEPTYYVKVSAQDPLTKKFLSTKDHAGAQALTKQIQDSLVNPTQKIIEKEIKNPDTLFGILADLTRLITRKSRNSLVVYGGAGVGKSFTVYKTLADEGKTKGKDWFLIKGKMTNADLYKNLYMLREDKILVFDDADGFWSNEEAANILKAVLDSSPERIVSWGSNRTQSMHLMSDTEKAAYYEKLDKELKSNPESVSMKYPAEFVFHGRIIFISNLAYDKFDSAVLTRSSKIDMTLTAEQIFLRIESLIDHMGDSSVPVDAKLEILAFLKKKYRDGNLADPSMRTFVAAIDCYKSGLPNWKDLIDYL